MYSKFILLTFFLLVFMSHLKAQDWKQLGSTLYRSDTTGIGFSVTSNGDGTLIAVTSGSVAFKSKVVVYKLIENEWKQFGNDIPCSCENVKFSDDGSTLIVGCSNDKDITGSTFSGSATVFKWDSAGWVQKGDKLFGAQYGLFGFSIGISEDGNSIAVYSRYDLNRVRVYTWNEVSNTWDQKGSAVSMGNSTSSVTGGSLDFSSDGNTFIIGNPYNNNGKVGVFAWNGGDWVQKGDLFTGSGDEHLGTSVSINRNGNTIMISSPLNDEQGNNTGEVKLYQWDGSSWVQKGQSFNGTIITEGDCCLADLVSGLDDSGNIAAFNIRVTEFPPWKVVRIYTWNGLEWIQKGLDIEGGTGENMLVDYLSFNASGDMVTIGIPYDFSYEDGYDDGRVKTCKWKSGLTIENFPSTSGPHLYSYPSKDLIIFSEEVNLVSVFDISGRLIRHFAPNGREMYISSFKPGTYMFRLATDKGIFMEKVIKE